MIRTIAEHAPPVRRKPAASLSSAFDEARLMDIQQLAEAYRVAVVTARRMYWRGLLPPAVRVGSRGIRWHAKDVLASLADLPAA